LKSETSGGQVKGGESIFQLRCVAYSESDTPRTGRDSSTLASLPNNADLKLDIPGLQSDHRICMVSKLGKARPEMVLFWCVITGIKITNDN
jgi:hypothetical protein